MVVCRQREPKVAVHACSHRKSRGPGSVDFGVAIFGLANPNPNPNANATPDGDGGRTGTLARSFGRSITHAVPAANTQPDGVSVRLGVGARLALARPVFEPDALAGRFHGSGALGFNGPVGVSEFLP